uniref:Uncharacterized protein n=1 Tax=Rhizophora mucronata TaxID=61149 RepID=A0A2P2QH24_RHIMU
MNGCYIWKHSRIRFCIASCLLFSFNCAVVSYLQIR